MPGSEAGGGLLTVDETADVLRVSTRTVRRWISAGQLPAVRLGFGQRPRVRIDTEDLAAFAADCDRRFAGLSEAGWGRRG